MLVIRGTDVNDLYYNGMMTLKMNGVVEETRNGPAIVYPCPVTSVYEKPCQRVLLDKQRKANPFFHLYESLWMLAGRNDVAALNGFITDFGTRFAEPDGMIHGAYGHRWRVAFGFDQLQAIVNRLFTNPQDRQSVLQMWDANEGEYLTNDGVGQHMKDLRGDWKDRPCNTHIYFRVRDTIGGKVLDMTILCRSNDIVYGAYGANAVHFSVLMEYMAGRIGVGVGTMYQVSNNYHAYVEVLGRVSHTSLMDYENYDLARLQASPMGDNWLLWDNDLASFMKRQRTGELKSPHTYANKWFAETADPMFLAHYLWKTAMKVEARAVAGSIGAEDWRRACLDWFDQRTDARSR
jgi:thymidylate synthase